MNGTNMINSEKFNDGATDRNDIVNKMAIIIQRQAKTWLIL